MRLKKKKIQMMNQTMRINITPIDMRIRARLKEYQENTSIELPVSVVRQ